MAIIGTVTTKFGEKREVYIRINNIGDITNHSVTIKPRLRGYLVTAMQSGEYTDFSGSNPPPYVWDSIEEDVIIECLIDVSLPIWSQVYEKAMVDPGFISAVENISADV